MGPVRKEHLGKARSEVSMSLNLQHQETGLTPSKGVFIFDMRDAQTGLQLVYWERPNIITRDAGLITGAHYKGELTGGIKMLAVGTGATGNLLSPDAPQATQRKLNNEIARKAFASTTYRTAEGVAVSYRTAIVDFTTTFGEGEAVGALNEMALMLPASLNPETKNPINNGPSNYDPSIDTTGKDLIANYLTFGVTVKPSTAVLSITWRLSF